MSASAEQSCPSIAKALKKILHEDRPEVLDLGPLCGGTVIYLASRGARVSVEEFRPPPPTPARAPGEPMPEKSPLAIPQPDGQFHFVLAWEQADFTPPDRLAELGAELVRILAPGGYVLLFCRDNPTAGSRGVQEQPGRWRMVADDRLIHEPVPAASERPRWSHLNRDIERALAPLKVQGIHLQRSRMREVLALKV